MSWFDMLTGAAAGTFLFYLFMVIGDRHREDQCVDANLTVWAVALCKDSEACVLSSGDLERQARATADMAKYCKPE